MIRRNKSGNFRDHEKREKMSKLTLGDVGNNRDVQMKNDQSWSAKGWVFLLDCLQIKCAK